VAKSTKHYASDSWKATNGADISVLVER